MGHGRKPKGRPAHLNRHSTRTATRTITAQAPGAGHWRRSHDAKVTFGCFCEALKTERLARKTRSLDGTRIPARETYSCRYGDHYLRQVDRTHWHIGRASDRL
jgi:hypothetical protein